MSVLSWPSKSQNQKLQLPLDPTQPGESKEARQGTLFCSICTTSSAFAFDFGVGSLVYSETFGATSDLPIYLELPSCSLRCDLDDHVEDASQYYYTDTTGSCNIGNDQWSQCIS